MTYFDYLKDVICYPGKDFDGILQIMFKEIFYLNPSDETFLMDMNRIEDALALREEYEMHGYQGDPEYLVTLLPKTEEGTCTVLELLAALARRIENDYLYDPAKGNRTWQWFYLMLYNMGLTEDYFKDPLDPHDIYCVQRHIYRIIDKTYNDDGTDGGLFPIPGKEVKSLELWDQMRLFLRENNVQ